MLDDKKITKTAFDLITKFEGFSATPYLCPAGRRTIGYGELMEPEDTREKTTKKEASVFVKKNISNILKKIKKEDLPLEREGQYSALISFVYNLGWSAFLNSTLLKKIKAKASENEIHHQWLRWVHAGGKILIGLQKRRQEEWAVFSTKATE